MIHRKALFALGAVVLALSVLDVDTAARPVLTLAFFALGPGAAVLPRLGVHGDFLMEASLTLAISVAVTMAVAQAMVWTGVFSPTAATAFVLGVMAVAEVGVPSRRRTAQEAVR